MRIVHITAGTGNFHCGNCVRDNALVAALQSQGHDVLMVPLYLPMVTDEADTSAGTPIFFGGLNVYLQGKYSLFRHTPRWIDALFDSTWLLRKLADYSGMTRARDLGELTLSTIRGEQGQQVKELDRLVDWLVEYSRAEIVCLSNALLIGLARRIKERLGVPVTATLQGEDGFLDSLVPPYSEQSWDTLQERAQDIDAFIAVSQYYGDLMTRRLAIPPEKVSVIPNGISLAGYPSERSEPATPTLGYLARMHPDKGLGTLVEAFIALKQSGDFPDLRLKVAGAKTPSDELYAQGQVRRLEQAGLGSFASFHPNLSHDEKIEFLTGLTAFSVPAVYGEAFGLYVIEGMAAGVPVVQPDHAGFPELLEATGGGILYDPTDANGLTDALARMLNDSDLRRRCGELGRAAVVEHYSVERMARDCAGVYESVLAGRDTVQAAV